MSGITLRIDKGSSDAHGEIMDLLSSMPDIKECKRHYTVRLSEEDMFIYKAELDRIMELMPYLQERDWFDIPPYGTDAWANWMIDLHAKKCK